MVPLRPLSKVFIFEEIKQNHASVETILKSEHPKTWATAVY